MQYNSAAACVYIMLECTGFLAESLFQFGGFGGNDYQPVRLAENKRLKVLLTDLL
jgi:hypothetical protein